MKRASVFSLFLVLYYASSVPTMSALCTGSSPSPVDPFAISSIIINGNVTVQFFDNKSEACLVEDKKEDNASSEENTLNNVTENCTCKSSVMKPPQIPVGYEALSIPTKDNNTFISTIKFHKDKKTWNEARKVCYHEGGFLSYPTNSEETALYKKTIKDNAETYLWTGIHDLFEEGKYTTILGEVADEVADMKWEKDQPDNWHNSEKCIHLISAGLNDINCNFTYSFICKLKLPRC